MLCQRGKKITSLNTIQFLDTYAFINNPHQQSRGMFIFLCKYYIVISDKLVGVFLNVLLLLLAVIPWEIKQERLGYRKKYIEVFVWGILLFVWGILLFVWGILLFWLHVFHSMSFWCFLCLLPLPSQVIHLRNGCYKDNILLWVVFCVIISWVNSWKYENL